MLATAFPERVTYCDVKYVSAVSLGASVERILMFLSRAGSPLHQNYR